MDKLKWDKDGSRDFFAEYEGVRIRERVGVRWRCITFTYKDKEYVWRTDADFEPLDDNIIAVAKQVKAAFATIDTFIDGRWPRED